MDDRVGDKDRFHVGIRQQAQLLELGQYGLAIVIVYINLWTP